MAFEKAYWIKNRNIKINEYTLFRKDFYIDKKIENAKISITSGYRHVLWINGAEVLIGPLRSHTAHKEYDVKDITKYLKVGRNSIAVICFFSKSANVPNSQYGLIAQIDIESGNNQYTIATDKTWVFKKADWFIPTVFELSSGEYQENFDFNLLEENWNTAEYQEPDENVEIQFLPSEWYLKSDCGDYSPVSVIGDNKTPPWINLIERTVPYSIYDEYTPECIWCGTDSKEIYNQFENPSIRFNAENTKGESTSIFKNEYTNETYNIFVFDFGKTRTIRPGLIINKLSGNGRVELYYNEKFGKIPKSMRGFGGANEGFCDTFIPRDGINHWKAITCKGARFVIVRISGNLKVNFSIDSNIVDYNFPEEQKPDINNPLMSKLWDIGSNTIKSSTTDFYVDTCVRENALWTMDACMTARAAYDTFGETAMWKRTLLSIAYAVDMNGRPQALAVPSGGNMILIDQNFQWVFSCLDYYKVTNDYDFLTEIYPYAKRFLEFAKIYETRENLFMHPSFSWNFVDWARIDRRPYSLPVNALYIMALSSMAEISKIIGKDDGVYISRRDSVKEACLRFFDNEKNAFLTHIEPESEISEYNQFEFKKEDLNDIYKYGIHANSLAISAEIGTEEMRKNAADFIILNSKKYGSDWLNFGPGWVYMLFNPLLDYYKKEDVIEILEKHYKNFVLDGQKTFCEGWGPELHNSAHGWGSAINSFLKKIYN